MHNSASASPAAKPPGTSMPASMTRAPLASVLRRDAQLAGALDAAIGQSPRALVHPEVGHAIVPAL